jgi:uncharacterized membrane protein
VFKFLVTLHVLAAVLLIGPFALAAFWGRRAIRRRDVDDTRDAARIMARFGIGSLVVALLGFGALSTSDRYTFRSPWVIISITLYVVAMGLATGYTVPALRKAAKMIDEGVLVPPPAVAAPPADEPEAAPLTLSATADDLALKERLDNVAGRVTGSGALVLLALVVITILMVTRPFGK